MKLSVALCTYNGEQFLARQLETIFLQTTPVQEIIICDDISTDHTLAIVEQFQQKYPGIIQLFVNEQTLGPRKNFEKAITLATGDIIFLCDQDDTWPVNKTAEIAQAFLQHPEAKGIFTNGVLIDEQEVATGMKLWNSFMYTDYLQSKLSPADLFEIILRNGPLITGATLAIRHTAKEIILPFKHADKLWHDEWIAYRLSAENSLMAYNKLLFNYRIHSKQQVGVYIDDFEKRSAEREQYFKQEIKDGGERMYIHFLLKRLNIARTICTLTGQRNDVLQKLEATFISEKKRAMRKIPFIKRKALLIKWISEKRFETRLKEVFFT